MLLGFGAASFLSQSMNMSGDVGGKSFIASARITGGPSVDEILKNVEWPEQFPFKEEDFQRYHDRMKGVLLLKKAKEYGAVEI